MKRFSLFFKIYLGFWLTIVITVGVFIYLERLIATEPVIRHWQNTMNKTVSFYAQEAAAIYDRGGTEMLKNYLQRLERATGIKAYLFREPAVEVTGETVPENIRKQAALVFKQKESFYQRSERTGIAIEKVKSPEGNTYLFAAMIPHPRPPEFGDGPPPPGMKPPGPPPSLPPVGPPRAGFYPNFLLRLLIGLVVSGIICYLLARYITSPIFKLGNATKQLANGNLSVRVKPTLGDRRDELSLLAKDFDVMAERIEKLLTSQRNLLRDVSHELRSPLARLNVALELCRQHSGPQTHKHLDRMALETDKLNDLIGQILTYNRMNAQSDDLQKIRFDLSELIEQIAADANYETNSSRAVIRANEPVFLTGNHDLLRRAIENVVRNALYHTPENSVVHISAETLLLQGQPHVRITVRDHGRGVPEESLPLIFKPFFKLGNGSGRHSGAGLGLAISEAAVRLHQGMILAKNADDSGLIIEINLPAEQETA